MQNMTLKTFIKLSCFDVWFDWNVCRVVFFEESIDICLVYQLHCLSALMNINKAGPAHQLLQESETNLI